MNRRKIRVVVAKPGLDGHDRGAKIIARALRDAGMEVIYTGLHQTPEQIVQTAMALLDQEGLAGLSMRKLAAKLGAGATSLYWYVETKDDLIDLLIDEIWGEVDVRSTLAVARQFEEAIPDTTLVVLPGAGHVSNLERPGEFNDAVRAFCRAHPPS